MHPVNRAPKLHGAYQELVPQLRQDEFLFHNYFRMSFEQCLIHLENDIVAVVVVVNNTPALPCRAALTLVQRPC